jgi:hypothetical protein
MAASSSTARRVLIELKKSQDLGEESLGALALLIEGAKGTPEGLSKFLDALTQANLAKSLLGGKSVPEKPKRLSDGERLLNTLRSNASFVSRLQEQIRG